MKKILFLGCFLIVVLCGGCRGLASSENSEDLKDSEVCEHNNYELDGVRYEGGKTCEDPITVYVICSDCGEEVKAGTKNSTKKCVVASGESTVIREATCTEDGLGTWTCGWCDTVREYTIEKLDHVFLEYWGERELRCMGCGTTTEKTVADHEHEYESHVSKDYSNEFRDEHAGIRYYNCKHCDHYYAEYFDGYGNFDLETVCREIMDYAKELGYQVILDREKFLIGYGFERVKAYLDYADTDSIVGTEELIETGKKFLDEWPTYDENQKCPENYYMYITVDYGYNISTPSFYVEYAFVSKYHFEGHWMK